MSAPDAVAAPAANYTPVITDATRLARVLFSPGAVFEEQVERPTFWTPWLVVSILFALMGWLNSPFQARAMQIASEAAGRPAPPAWMGLIGVALSPVIVLVIALIGAVVLWVPVMAMGEDAGIKKLRTVVIFAMPVTILQLLATFIVLKTRGIDAIQSAADAQVSLGLDLLLSPESGTGPFVKALLGGIGLFPLWSMAVQAIGLTSFAKVPKGKAWTAAGIAYAVGLLIAAGIGGMFGPR